MGVNAFCRDYGDFVQYRIFDREFREREVSDYVETDWSEFQDTIYSWDDVLNGVAVSEPHCCYISPKEWRRIFLEKMTPEERENHLIAEKHRSFNNSVKRTKDKIYDYAQCNKWDYMATFTFKNGACPYPYPEDPGQFDQNMKVIKKWFNNIVTRYYEGIEDKLKYLVIPELGGKTGRFHFHALMANCGPLDLLPGGRDHDDRQIYNLKQWKKGFSTLKPVYDNFGACNYILKYITKQVAFVSSGRSRYLHSSGLETVKVEKLSLSEEEKKELIYGSVADSKTMYVKTITSEFGQTITYIAKKK